MIHEVFDSALAAAEMPLQTLSHHAPAKPGSVRDGRISVFHTKDALFDNIKHLAVERGLESIRHMTGKLLLQMDRFLADRSIEVDRLLDRLRRRLSAADHFDQWNDVRRVERMPDDNPFRMFALRLNHTRR